MERKSREKGAIMLEAIFVMVITMLVLVWLLAVGFLYYQRYTTTVVTNDAAVKIASTYNNPSSDIIMGYVATEDVSGRNLYRNFTSGSASSNLLEVNEKRAEAYVKYILDKANFSGVVEDVDVELKHLQYAFRGSAGIFRYEGRKHVLRDGVFRLHRCAGLLFYRSFYADIDGRNLYRRYGDY